MKQNSKCDPGQGVCGRKELLFEDRREGYLFCDNFGAALLDDQRCIMASVEENVSFVLLEDGGQPEREELSSDLFDRDPLAFAEGDPWTERVFVVFDDSTPDSTILEIANQRMENEDYEEAMKYFLYLYEERAYIEGGVFLSISRCYMSLMDDPFQLINFVDDVLEVYKFSGLIKNKMLLLKAESFWIAGYYEEALSILDLLYCEIKEGTDSISEGELEFRMKVVSNLANVFFDLERFEIAIELYDECLSKFAAISETEGVDYIRLKRFKAIAGFDPQDSRLRDEIPEFIGAEITLSTEEKGMLREILKEAQFFADNPQRLNFEEMGETRLVLHELVEAILELRERFKVEVCLEQSDYIACIEDSENMSGWQFSRWLGDLLELNMIESVFADYYIYKSEEDCLNHIGFLFEDREYDQAVFLLHYLISVKKYLTQEVILNLAEALFETGRSAEMLEFLEEVRPFAKYDQQGRDDLLMFQIEACEDLQEFEYGRLILLRFLRETELIPENFKAIQYAFELMAIMLASIDANDSAADCYNLCLECFEDILEAEDIVRIRMQLLIILYTFGSGDDMEIPDLESRFADKEFDSLFGYIQQNEGLLDSDNTRSFEAIRNGEDLYFTDDGAESVTECWNGDGFKDCVSGGVYGDLLFTPVINEVAGIERNFELCQAGKGLGLARLSGNSEEYIGDVDKVLEQAKQKFRDQEFVAALRLYDQAIALQPGNYAAVRGRFTTLISLERYQVLYDSIDDHLVYFQNKNREYILLYCFKGIALKYIGMPEEALKVFRNLDKLDYEDFGLLTEYAEVLFANSLFEEALRVFKKILVSASDTSSLSEIVHLGIIKSLVILGQENEAINHAIVLSQSEQEILDPDLFEIVSVLSLAKLDG